MRLWQDNEHVKIVSLNLRGFFDWNTRLPSIMNYLAREQPDLVLCQEVVFLPDISQLSNLDVLNRVAAFPHRHSAIDRMQPSDQFGLYREGLSVLSRTPVISSESIILKHEESDPHHRLVQFFEIAAADETVWMFANVHFSVRDDYAIHHFEEVLGILSARSEKRIIGGDFNINHLEQYAHLWRDEYVLTTQLKTYISFPGTNQANDYFLVPKEYELKSIEVSDDSLSDHRALAVDVTKMQPARRL